MPEPRKWAGSGRLPSSITHITSFLHGAKGWSRGGGNWELEINVAQVAGT